MIVTECLVWRIALSTPLWRKFDYLPSAQRADMQPGMRVRVPFGTRSLIGIYLGSFAETEIPLQKLKPVAEVLDNEPIFSAELLRLCQWIGDYYHHPLGEVLLSALPKMLREGKSLERIKNKKIPAEKTVLAVSAHTLNTDQQKIFDAIKITTGFKVFLLAGVTGSGKTEVYLQAIDFILQQQRQALFIVPEISLTPQTIERFKARFKVPIAIMHSGLAEGERARMWLLAKEGQAPIVIGTRSAIFAPLSRLGIIIVDEEHDASLKSQSNVRYSARDLAVIRAQMNNIPVILGSATPALESFYNAMRHRYELFSLPERAGDARAPKIKIINLRDEKLQAGMTLALINAIHEKLAQKKQVLIFLNRRGYAPVFLCHHCGFMLTCKHCDARLTFHAKPPRLICHHCDQVYQSPRICAKCHKSELMPVGQGTEKIESVLATLFPNHSILRVDRDTTATRHSLEEKLELINTNKVDILIGTQMLAKGHHFPNLGLSAVIDLDGGFFSADFRAVERMCQLLVQVSGRAGRSKELGEVIIQTHYPQHPYLQQLFQQGYFDFLQNLLAERQLVGLPPYSYQALIRAGSTKKDNAIIFLQKVRELFLSSKIQVYGPMSALLERKAGRYQQQLLLQSTSRSQLQNALENVREKIPAAVNLRGVRWSIDVDPTDLM